MTVISTLTTKTTPASGDLLVGTDSQDSNATKNFLLSGIAPVILRNWTHIRVAGTDARNKDYADIVCNGTDDQDDLHTARDALTNGGVVEFIGRLNIGATIVWNKPHVHLRGVGPGWYESASSPTRGGSSRLVAATGLTGPVLQTGDMTTNAGIQNHLTDFAVDGNGVATMSDGIQWRSVRSHMARVYVFDCAGNGITCTGRDEVTFNAYDLFMFQVHCKNNGGAGIHMGDHATDNHIVGAICADNAYGIRFQNSGSSHQIVDLHTYDNSVNGMLIQDTGSRIKVVNWKCEQSHNEGLRVTGTTGSAADCQFSVCNFKNNSRGNDGLYSHILLDPTSSMTASRCKFTNICFDWTEAEKAEYFIELASSNVRDCQFSGLSYDALASVTSGVAYLDNGQRNTFEGWGTNAGNPSSAGNWLNNGREGVMVRDTSGGGLYAYLGGAWRTLA